MNNSASEHRRRNSAGTHLLILLACFTLLAGCITTAELPQGVLDARGNLSGDHTRTYLDILESSCTVEGDTFAFSVRTASRTPAANALTGGKRIDFIWFVDADMNQMTGQGPSGNDFNIHLWLDETGWHTAVFAVSEVALAHGNPPEKDACAYRVDGTRFTVLVPQKALPDAMFEWWASSTTQNAPTWPPVTHNPPTRRATSKPSQPAAMQNPM